MGRIVSDVWIMDLLALVTLFCRVAATGFGGLILANLVAATPSLVMDPRGIGSGRLGLGFYGDPMGFLVI